MPELKDLLISGADIDQALVAGALKPFVRIDKDTRTVRPQAAWRHASNQAKILAYLLARKAMLALDLDIAMEPAAPSDIIKETGIPKGSVYPTLKEMYEARPQLVDKDAASRYWVPNWAIDAACEVLAANAEEQET